MNQYQKLIFVFTILILTSGFTWAQSPAPKTLPAKRFTGTIVIDGELNDSAWKNAPLATEFVEFRPTPGKKESQTNRTEMYLLYSNEGIYLAGYCHEASKDSISTEPVSYTHLTLPTKRIV